MSFRLRVDASTVVAAASSVRRLVGDLDAAPGGAALRTVAAALPGGALADAAAEEAAEWATEMAEAGAAFERWAGELEAAVAAHRRLDADAASGLRAGP